MHPEDDDDDDRDEYDGCNDFEEEYDDDGHYDNPADDYIMTEPELRGHL